MMKKTIAVLALSLAACKDPTPLTITMPNAAESRAGSMVVNGSATLELSPDCADLTMTITADGARPGEAASSLKSKQTQLVAALAKLKLDGDKVKLSYLNLSPIYRTDTDGGWSQLHVATYRASVTITATTKQFDQISAIMEAGAQAGASSMSSQFRRSDLVELKKKVREMALRAAQEKAVQTAKTLGVPLGPIVSVAENPGGQMWSSQYFPSNSVASDTATATLSGVSQQLTLDVTIGYELSKHA